MKSPGLIDLICAEIARERWLQDEKWGEQNHPDGTGGAFFKNLCVMAKKEYEDAADAERITWNNILTEEFYEALAESDGELLREELIQCAAVCVAWIECIDRRES